MREEFINDVKRKILAGEELGRRAVQKLYNISEGEARIVLEIAKYLAKKEKEGEFKHFKEAVAKIKKKEDKKEKQEEFLLQLLANAVKSFEPPQITQKIKYGRGKGEETAIILLSDWHIGETVKPELIQGLNAYNTKIAGARLEYFVDKAVELIELQRSYTVIETAVVWLGGDIVSGLIHDELLKNADLTVIEQVAVAGYLLAQVIAELSTVFKRVKVITTVGNHGRMTKKYEFKNKSIESLDYLAYQICAFALRNYKNVEMHVSKNIFLFEDVNGWRFVFSHGDETKSWASIPFYGLKRDFANKQVLNAFTGRFSQPVQPVNYKVVGHFHITGLLPEGAGYVIMNGSLKGIDEYAFAKGLFTRPSQFMFGVHKEYGITWNYAVWLDNFLIKREEPKRFITDLPDTWAELSL